MGLQGDIQKEICYNVIAMKIIQVIREGILFELEPEEKGGYTITVPALPGCISYGKTFEETFEMIFDAMKGWIEVAKEENLDIPEEVEKFIMVSH